MQTVTLTAADCRLVLTARGYQFPDRASGSDANRLHAEAELTAGRGRFTAQREPLWLGTDELEGFCVQLQATLERGDGVAVLEHLESRVGATVTVTPDGAALTAFLSEHMSRHARTELRVEGAAVDPASLLETLRELRELVTAYPVRGRAYG